MLARLKTFVVICSRPAAVRYAIASLVVLPLLIALRYRSGAHYLPVAVELTDAWENHSENQRVHVISPFGTTRVLERDASNPGLFRSKDYVGGPVQSVCISGGQEEYSDPGSVSLILGTSKTGLSSRVKLINLPEQVDKLKSQIGGSCVVFGKKGQSESVIPTASRCINWQGDFWLVLVCLVQSICLVGYLKLFASLFIRCWRKYGQDHPISSVGNPWKSMLTVRGVIFSCLVFLLMIILVHQLRSETIRFLCTGNVFEHLSGLILLFLAVLFINACSNQSEGTPKSRKRFSGLIVVSVTILIITRCLVSGNWPWFQTGDYGAYWKYGGWMSTGDWSLINDGYLGRDMMAIRAFLYSFPIRVLAGDSTAVLVIVNNVCLVGAAVLLYRLVAASCGRNVAFVSALSFSLYPDILFGGHLCRHDNPAMLYLGLLFTLMPKIFESLRTGQSLRMWSVGGLVSALGAGGLIGLLEAQRSYMPFLIAAAALCVGGAAVASYCDCRRLNFPWLKAMIVPLRSVVLFSVIISSAFLTNASIAGHVRSLIGSKETYRNSGMMMSMETESDHSWQSFVPFSALYTRQIPEKSRFEFFLRKILFEKVQSGTAFWGSLVRKNETISGTHSAIMSSGGTRQFEMFPSIFNVPFVSVKFTWGSGWYLVLLGFGVIRLLLLPVLSVRVEELFPAMFSFVFMTALLVFAEAGQQYDLVLAFPLSISGAVVLNCRRSVVLAGGPQELETVDVRLVARKVLMALAPGAVVLCSCVALQTAASHFLASHPERTFARPSLAGGGIRATGETNRCASVLLPEVGDGLKNGDACSVIFEVTEAELATDAMRFFISYDQRRSRIFPETPFVDLPLSFSVSIDGAVAATGKLSDLTNPPFVVHQYVRNGGAHYVKLQIRADADVAKEELGDSGNLAIEYVH